jgi:[acyl-carrier-protein] S-malonyltransferase
VCFEGSAEELERTDVCQPAILTVSVAVMWAIEEEAGERVKTPAAAGLSLGEYSALVAARTIEFADAVRLVCRRARFMQEACEANPGAMYSIIGLADGKVEEACDQVRHDGGRVWPANYNNPGQLVISGEKEAAARVARQCKGMGAKRALELKVAGAFHCPLMQEAADRLAAELARVELREPDFPVVANATAEPTTTLLAARELLARQVTSPVRWSQSMDWCVRQGHRQYLEVGPGRALKGMLKRIDRDSRCESVAGAAEVKAIVGIQ